MEFSKSTLHAEEEAKGLRALARLDKIRCVRVLSFDPHSITLEKIQTESPSQEFWRRFGRELAELHDVRFDSYGFETENHIGATLQPNPTIPIAQISWTDYFIEHRLRHMLRNPKLVSNSDLQAKFNKAEPQIRKELNKVKEAPSLVHGDLWNGNFLCAEDQEPVLIDPAPYRGHREVDLAMSELFGGFDPIFYQAYRERLPLAAAYDKRRDIYNLYHLLNHWIIFDGGYTRQALTILENIS